jgi:hypothetical protein
VRDAPRSADRPRIPRKDQECRGTDRDETHKRLPAARHLDGAGAVADAGAGPRQVSDADRAIKPRIRRRLDQVRDDKLNARLRRRLDHPAQMASAINDGNQHSRRQPANQRLLEHSVPHRPIMIPARAAMNN